MELGNKFNLKNIEQILVKNPANMLCYLN